MPLILDQDISNQEFKSLYFEYFPLAHRTAIYILKNMEAAEDVAQNVFLKLWDRREQIGELETPKAYVIMMAKNGALDALKSQNTLGEEYIPLAFENDLTNDESEKIRLAIEKAVTGLSPKCRLVFSLSRFEGLTNPEIAEYLDVSIRTVETQISNALKMFRTDLKHHFTEFLLWGLLLGYPLYN